jgi:hypothetical protein
MDTKKLCKALSLSWTTVEKIFICDPNFSKMRVGKEWVFNRQEVQDYIDKWSAEFKQREIKGYAISFIKKYLGRKGVPNT